MSLKSIDMQIALSRTSETSHVQNQLNHKPAYDQALLNDVSKHEIMEDRHKNEKLRESAEMHLRKDKKNKGQSEGKKKRSSAGESKNIESLPQTNEHPYLGHHVDITL